jgi:hypothetical protein
LDTFGVYACDRVDSPTSERNLAARLLALVAHDDEVRARLAAEGSLFEGAWIVP